MNVLHPLPMVSPSRRGSSLAEVLVSLLVLSVGVVAVATLFPLSVLRTIQATQLTNGTQLRYNFEGLAGARPELNTGAGVWQAGASYQQGDLVLSSEPNNFYYECTTAGTSGASEPGWQNRSGQTTPDTNTSGTNPEWVTHFARVYMVDPLGWQERLLEQRDLGTPPALGTADVRNTFGRLTLGPPPTLLPMDSRYRIVRFRGGVARNPQPPYNFNPSSSTFYPALNSLPDLAARFGAQDSAILPDSWELQTESTDLANATPTSVQIINGQSQLIQTLEQDTAGPGLGSLDFIRGGTGREQTVTARITFTDETGTRSVVRQITTVTRPAANIEQINWLTPLPAPPAGNSWAKARVETFDQRYSWMLAVRRQDSGSAYRNLVVFFRRSFAPEDELIHPAHFRVTPGSAQPNVWPGADGAYDPVGDTSPDDIADLNLNTVGIPQPVLAAGPDNLYQTTDDVLGKSIVIVQYNPALGAGSPYLRRGGFICDAQNNRWYRIVSYEEVPNAQAALQLLDGTTPAGTLGTGRGAIVKLSSPVLGHSGIYPLPTPTPPNTPPGGALLLRGVIEVYALQPQLSWEQ